MYSKKSLLILFTLLLLLPACIFEEVNVGATVTESESVEIGGAETARVDINMGIGELTVQGGADNLMDAEFTYNIETWKPEVDYEVSGDNGRLSVSQPESQFEGIPNNDDIENLWELKFNDTIPLNMDVDLGVGEGELVLSGINLSNLTVNAGVGKVVVDLTGNWSESFNVNVEGGVGQTIIKLPSEVGVRVEAQQGLGNIDVENMVRNGDVYTNFAYAESDIVIDIHVEGGVGNITLEQEG
ncbi:MAG: hypothetical protein GY943_32300 [Chloroflexi bacterium]|nr:hypothetical protein [Chloroflexota bacterium]